MSAPNRSISHEEAVAILRTGRYGVLSTVSPDGSPYGIPVNYCFSEEENLIFFHCAKVGKKIDNMKFDSRVSLVVVGYDEIVPERFITHYESVVVTGKASFVSEESVKRARLVQISEKFAPKALARREEVISKSSPATAICEITIEELTGKRNNDD